MPRRTHSIESVADLANGGNPIVAAGLAQVVTYRVLLNATVPTTCRIAGDRSRQRAEDGSCDGV